MALAMLGMDSKHFFPLETWPHIRLRMSSWRLIPRIFFL